SPPPAARARRAHPRGLRRRRGAAARADETAARPARPGMAQSPDGGDPGAADGAAARAAARTRRRQSRRPAEGDADALTRPRLVIPREPARQAVEAGEEDALGHVRLVELVADLPLQLGGDDHAPREIG